MNRQGGRMTEHDKPNETPEDPEVEAHGLKEVAATVLSAAAMLAAGAGAAAAATPAGAHATGTPTGDGIKTSPAADRTQKSDPTQKSVESRPTQKLAKKGDATWKL